MAKRVLARLALLLFGFVLAAGLLEIGLRLWFETRGTERDRMLYLYRRDEIDARTAQVIGVPYLNYVLNPAWDGVNARGVRGPLVAAPKPDGVFRIVALGGSTTFGHDLADDETWPAQLQRILREDYGYSQVEVVNLGVPGFHSTDSVVSLATRGLALDPDLVITYDGLNDVVVRMYQDPACYAGDTPLFGFGMDRGLWQPGGEALPPSALYRVIAYQLGWLDDPTAIDSRLQPTGWCPPEPDGTSQLDLLAQNPPTYFARNLHSMAALARASNARLMLATFAWDVAAAEAILADDPSQDGTRALIDGIVEHNALVQQIAADEDALLLDLAAEMGPGAYFQGDQVHQTAEGARRQAALFALFLDAEGVIR